MRTIFEEMRRMQEEMDLMFERVFPGRPFGHGHKLLEGPRGTSALARRESLALPLADVWETDNEVKAEIDVPGVDKKDINLSITDDRVEIRAEKKQEKKETKKERRYFERSYAGFYRAFALPSEVDANKAKADYKDGVLHLSMPKAKKDKPKGTKVEVK